MSKRCELQKEYYQQYGNYKGNGKYCNKYVSWLENEVLALRKTAVSRSALLDWNEKVIRAKRDFAIAFTKWVNSPEHKKMIEAMKRLGAIR